VGPAEIGEIGLWPAAAGPTGGDMFNSVRWVARVNPRNRRRGVTSMLAMLYLILFSSLAIGFFAITTAAVQVAKNDSAGARALLAAESGIDFCRYHLASLQIPRNTPKDQLLDRIHEGLAEELDYTMNLNYGQVERIGEAIVIRRAGSEKAIQLDDRGSGFMVIIRRDNDEVVATSLGHYTTAHNDTIRGIEVRFTVGDGRTNSSVLDFGVATRGTVTMDSNAILRGLTDKAHANLLSTSDQTPQLTMLSNTIIEGQVVLTDEDGTVRRTTQKIEGGVAIGGPVPEFPEISTDGFRDIVPLTAITGSSDANHRNILIRANSNPKLTGTIEGMIYIESPNRVTFDSNCVIRGIIVAPTGGTGTREIIFDSNTKLNGVETLPATSNFPQALRDLAGTLILAPEFKLTFNSNFGAAGGAIVGSEVYFDSNAAGSITGTILALSDRPVVLRGNANIAIQRPPAGATPAGMFFRGGLLPKRAAYEEGPQVIDRVSGWHI
jgi:hypothetical protein